MRIGFFDSGIGGITVLYDALKILPNEDYIYYADTLNVPYGTKTKAEVKQFVFEAADFIVKKEVKALVIACNTATSVAIEDLRNKYDIPIIGMEPAVKPAVKMNDNNKRILVIATELTLKEEKLKNLILKIDKNNIIDLLPLPKLVEFSERFIFDEKEVLPYLNEKLSKYDFNLYKTIVLGCTHFSYYKDMFRKILPPAINIIDGNTGTINNLKRILEQNNIINEGNGDITFYNSGLEINNSEKADKYKHLFKTLDKINLNS